MDLGRSDPNSGWARLFKGWAGVDEALTRIHLGYKTNGFE